MVFATMSYASKLDGTAILPGSFSYNKNLRAHRIMHNAMLN